MSQPKKIHLVVIDPQNDFCSPKGSLFVNGADEDMKRLAAFIRSRREHLSDISVTLDSHQYFDIGHPVFWVNPAGEHPNPHPPMPILEAQVDEGEWRAAAPNFQKWAEYNVHALATHNRYPLMIWPPHCLIGTWGHLPVEEVRDALSLFERRPAKIQWVTKGTSSLTEHYSAVQADVPDPADPDTLPNAEWIARLEAADEVLVCGEAEDFCIANTVSDAAALARAPDFARKMVLLTDCTSPVFADRSLADPFLSKMKALGMRTVTSVDYFT